MKRYLWLLILLCSTASVCAAQGESVTIVPCAGGAPGPCWLTHGVTTTLAELFPP